MLDFIVIIPTLNEERNIEKTLQYIKKQRTQATVKVVVVDGGSTDRTVEIAKKYVKVLKSPKKGKAHQLNYAAAQTDSKFLIFLDADTHIPWNYIERVKNAFQKDPELWACSGHIFYKGKNFGGYFTVTVVQSFISYVEYALFHYIWFLLQRLPNAHFKLRTVNYFMNMGMIIFYTLRQLLGFPEFSGSNICIRRKIFDEVGGFQQPPKLGVDYLFCRSLRAHIRKKKHGKMKIIHTLIVETDIRHLGLRRSLKRFKIPYELTKFR